MQPRVTRWTDTRGRPRQDLRGLFEVTWLARFKAAGIPKSWLHPSGAFAPFGSDVWASEGDLEGCFADALYIAGQCLNGLTDDDNPDPGAQERLKVTVDLMGRLASRIGRASVVSEFRNDLKGLMSEFRNAAQDGYLEIQAAWDAVAGGVDYYDVLKDPELHARCREATKGLWREQLKRIHGPEGGEAAYAEIYGEAE